MRKTNPLQEKVESLRVGGTPLVVKTKQQRMDCFNIAGRSGYEIKTRKSLLNVGFEIHRVK